MTDKETAEWLERVLVDIKEIASTGKNKDLRHIHRMTESALTHLTIARLAKIAGGERKG